MGASQWDADSVTFTIVASMKIYASKGKRFQNGAERRRHRRRCVERYGVRRAGVK